MSSLEPLVTLHSVDPNDDLSEDEFDALVLVQWLEWKHSYGSPDDPLWNAPPASAVFDAGYPDVTANAAAWRIMLDGSAWAALDLTLAQALAFAPHAPEQISEA